MKAIVLCLALIGAGSVAFAEETPSEKAAAQGNDVKRDVKKAGHKMQEAMCMEGDAKCAAKKAGHKMKEGADYGKDKAKEGINKVD